MMSTRKKSCAACVAGKRRCDLDLPTCARCKRAKKECVYPWMAVGDTVQGFDLNSLPSNTQHGRIWIASGSNSSSSEDGNWPSPDPSLTVPTPLVPGLLSQLDGYLSKDQDQAVLSLGPSPRLIQQSLASADFSTPEFVYFDISNTPPTIGAVFQSRTEYAADRLATQPQMLAMAGHNCFIHHTQVSSSEVLQEALAASALHCMRNTANAVLVRGEIAKRVARLIGGIRHAITSSASGGGNRELDLLPVLQALVVYQCIRYFARDDINERMRAERDEAIVQSLLAALYPRLRSFSKGIDGWHAWIYHESMRRTILTAEILAGTYTFLKQGWDQVEGRTLQLQFTAQVALWTAKSAVEWQAMWTRGPKLEVTMRSWNEDTREALPEDLDDLGHVLWALHHGLDVMENWLGKVGGRWVQPVMESWD
ncbi:hypothetical protein ACQKWADRAFT_283274 [Trichoderma austrokoningii]